MQSLTRRFHPQRVRRALGAAACVAERAKFVGHELRDDFSLERYRLRASGLVVQLRQPLLDAWVLEEVFRFGAYRPPEKVRRALAPLADAPRILDLGGHVGLFGLYMRCLFKEAAVTSFEPDPGNAALLRECIEANRLERRWRTVEACADTSDGTAAFVSSFHLSRKAPEGDSLDSLKRGIDEAFPFLQGTALTKRQPARSVQTRDVFPFLAEADIVKIDVEGTEWEILADARFASTPAVAVVLEYHPAYFSGPDAETAATAAFTRAGFSTETTKRGPDGGTIWAWREAVASS